LRLIELDYTAVVFCDREDKEGVAREVMREILSENRDGLEIDLQKLLMAYISKWWLIALCTLIAAVGAFYVTSNVIAPMYQAKVTVYVNNTASGQQVDYVSNANLATSQRLVNTYINIIESDTVLEKVAEASGMEITAGQIRGMMSAKQVDDTELFDVFVIHADPELAAQLANAVAKVAPGEIEDFVEGSSTKIIDYAKVPVQPVSPNVSRNCVLGAMMGVVVALVYLTLRFLLDVRIKDEEDLNMLFDVPVLAQIPAFLPEGSRRRNSYRKHAYETDEEKKGGSAR